MDRCVLRDHKYSRPVVDESSSEGIETQISRDVR